MAEHVVIALTADEARALEREIGLSLSLAPEDPRYSQLQAIRTKLRNPSFGLAGGADRQATAIGEMASMRSAA